jgi:hypothetical protein
LPTTLSSEHLRSLAAHGARARLLELESEVAAISAAFPDLAGAAEERSRSRGPARLKRKRSKISAEGRRRIAEAQEEEMGRTEERSRNFAVTSPPRAHVCRSATSRF